mgnify:CR=1 FL=1
MIVYSFTPRRWLWVRHWGALFLGPVGIVE